MDARADSVLQLLDVPDRDTAVGVAEELPMALANFRPPEDYSARSSRARTYTITNDAMGQSGKEIASVWGTCQIGAIPADEDEWQDSEGDSS